MIDQEYGNDLLFVEAIEDGARLISSIQRLEGEVTAGGLRVNSTASPGREGFTLQLSGLGRVGSAGKAPSLEAQISIDDNLVRVKRGELTEEYMVSAGGIRQDFLLAESPRGEGKIRLELTLTGASAAATGDGARFTLKGDDRSLTYAGLLTLDALGRQVPSRMIVDSPDTIALLVDDREATYPLRIDPTISDENWVGLQSGAQGTNSKVRALAVDGDGNLYVGGAFTTAGGIEANRVAKWDGNSWSALGSGIADGYVNALAVDSAGNLYAGGHFTHAGGIKSWSIARWDGHNWSALGSGISMRNDTDMATVHDLAVDSNGNLYVGGNFGQVDGRYINYLARWDGSNWSEMGEPGLPVYALAVDNQNNLYAGGATGGAIEEPQSPICKWNGSSWSTVGIASFDVLSLAVDNSGNLYAGGKFINIDGVEACHIARWNGDTWSALGSGLSNIVWGLAADNKGNLYAGGQFYYIARWNGSPGKIWVQQELLTPDLLWIQLVIFMLKKELTTLPAQHPTWPDGMAAAGILWEVSKAATYQKLL